MASESVSEAVKSVLAGMQPFVGRERLLAASARKLAEYVDSLEVDSGKPELTELRITLEQLEQLQSKRAAEQPPKEEDPVKKLQNDSRSRRSNETQGEE